MNTPDEATLRRLKKLLAMAMDGRGNQAEAENAMRMAQKLMAAHGLTEGALAASEVGETAYVSSKTKIPPPYESAILRVLKKAFGIRHYWTPSHVHRGCGSWHIVAPKHQLELVRYTFDVVRRQLLKARATFVATLPAHQGRMEKAAQGDAFGIAFVEELEKKILDFANLDPAIEQALEAHVDRICGGNKVKRTSKVTWTHGAVEAGRAAGTQATLHRPMGGRAETLKIGR